MSAVQSCPILAQSGSIWLNLAQSAESARISSNILSKTWGDLGFDALFAGHTHGQVCLPWLGPIVTLSRVARSIAAGGVHALGSTSIVVSRGLGWEGHIAPRVRLFCRPHLLLLELVPAELPAIAGKA